MFTLRKTRQMLLVKNGDICLSADVDLLWLFGC